MKKLVRTVSNGRLLSNPERLRSKSSFGVMASYQDDSNQDVKGSVVHLSPSIRGLGASSMKHLRAMFKCNIKM